MFSGANKPSMLSVIRLNAIMLSVVAPFLSQPGLQMSSFFFKDPFKLMLNFV